MRLNFCGGWLAAAACYVRFMVVGIVVGIIAVVVALPVSSCPAQEPVAQAPVAQAPVAQADGTRERVAKETGNADAGFRWIRQPGKETLYEDGQKVLSFQFAAKQLDGKKTFSRAHYVHPLYDLSGQEISEDFPQDHPHHRGIFWSWHQVTVAGQAAGDAWLCDEFQWDSQSIRTSVGGRVAEVHARAIWRSPRCVDVSGTPVDIATDDVTIVVHSLAGQKRVIDFTIRLQAMAPDVRIGGSDDDKGYGGFSTRIRMPPSLEFISDAGVIQPTKTAVTAGRWMLFRSEPFSYAILAAKDNPGERNRWILRKRRSMQNPVFPGREPITLRMDQPIELNYRVVIMQGGQDQAFDLPKMLRQYDDELGG